MEEEEAVFARCKKPRHSRCQGLQELKRPIKEGQELRNLCEFCRGPLRIAKDAEIRQWMIQQSMLNAKKERRGT
jgi:hypothetical protein